MRLLILLVIVGVCLVSAKYLPDESNNFKQLLSHHKRSDPEDSPDESSSNDTDDISDEELREQSKLHARIEKMRQKLLEKQEKERRRQEEAQQKLEEKITKELQKEEERRQKEEEKRQKELQKEEERRQKELQKEEARRQKEEEKRQKELLKHDEKLEKERIKLEERQKKLKEKTFENEQKRQEMLEKQLEEMEEETLKLQEGDSNSSNSDTTESSELEDFWKSYIYAKYGLNESNTELEKRIALRRYMQEELGLNVNSTESERRQAILRLIESKWQAVSEQYVLQSQMIDFVNRVGVEKIRAQIEKEIEEINNKTDILNNINLPWVQLARDNFAEQASFLQTIKEFLASILPNWYDESIPSTESSLNEASSQNEKVTSLSLENQDQNAFDSPIGSSDVTNKGDSLSNINNSNDINTPVIPLSENSGSNVAIDFSSTNLDKNLSPAIENTANEVSVTKGAGDSDTSIIADVSTNEPAVLGTVVNKSDIVSTTVTTIAPGSNSDFADIVSNSKNEGDSNSFSTDGTNLVIGTNPISKSVSTNLMSNKDVLSSVITKDASSPSTTLVLSNPDIVLTTATGSTPDNAPDTPVISISNTEVDNSNFSTDGINSATGTNTNSIIPAGPESTSSNLISNNNASPSVISTDVISTLPASTSATPGDSLNSEQDSGSSINGNVVPIANEDSISNSVSKTSDTVNSVAGKTDDLLISEIKNNINQDKSDAVLQSLENASIKTNVNDTLPSTDGSDAGLNRPADKMNSPSIDQDTSVAIMPTDDLSKLVTNILSSLITTEASEVVPQVASDLESKLNSDILQNISNNAKEANNNLTDVPNAPLSNNLANNENILSLTTERSELNIIKRTDGDTGIGNKPEDIISTASNYTTSTDATIYTSSSSSNDNNPIITLLPVLLTESQDSASSINNNSTNTEKSNITAAYTTTVITESSDKIIAPNAEPVEPIVDVATNKKNEENISNSPIGSITESHTDKIFTLNITPNDATSNNEETISILITTTESAKPIVNESIDSLHLGGVNVASKVDDQNISKTFDITENQNSSEPLTTTSSIDLHSVTSTVSDATYEKDALVITTIFSPSDIVRDNVDVASKGPTVSNSDIIISKNTSTNSNVVSDVETTEIPTSVTDSQTTVLDESTSIASDAQQVGNDNITENQYTETDVTVSDTGIPTVTESGNNELIKDQENPINNITVPVEPGASVIAVAQQ